MIEVLQVLELHLITFDGYRVLVFGEHPEDLGASWREEDGMKMQPASIWQLPELQRAAQEGNALHLFTVVFNQCCWGAPYRKPTRLLTNLQALRDWGPLAWPTFDGQGCYSGPATDLCACLPTVSLARTAADDTFRTSATSIYPEPMDRALAQAILSDLQVKPSSTKEGGECRKRVLDPEDGKTTKRPRLEATLGRDKATLCSGKATLSSGQATLCSGKATLCSDKATLGRAALVGAALGGSESSGSRVKPGIGPPIQTRYKGTALHP